MKTFITSLSHALRGIGVLFQSQRNARIHLAIAVLAAGLGIFCGLEPVEWTAIILCIGLVLAMEAANTALEFLADAVHPEKHPLVGRAKDVAAAAVLFAALASLAVGAAVFLPKIL